MRVRAFGVYSYRIADARVFFRRVSGTRDAYGVADLEGQLRSTLVSTLADHLGQAQIPFLDMAAGQDALARAIMQKASPPFADLGLALDGFQIQNISLPDELQKRLDERIGMGIVGDLSRYTEFQVAQSIPTAAAAGGAAGAGVGIGAGIAMGQVMGQAISRAGSGAANPTGPPQTAGPTAQTGTCPRCQTRIDRPGKFCPECGASLA